MAFAPSLARVHVDRVRNDTTPVEPPASGAKFATFRDTDFAW
jgi:hypothetical protein